MRTGINNLFNLSYNVNIAATDESIREELADVLTDIPALYSYIIYRIYSPFVMGKESTILSYKVGILISQQAQYNTILVADAINEIVDKVRNSRPVNTNKYVAGYRQPSLEILYETFQPLIHKLVQWQHGYWQQLQADDLYQMCSLCLTKLYKDGYYIHKQLLAKTFANYVLCTLRPEKNKPAFISFDEPVNDEEGGLTIGETIEDIAATERLEELTGTTDNEVYTIQLGIVKSMLSKREYDQVLFEYGTNNTTPRGRGIVNRLKVKLRDLNITNETILNKVINDGGN